MLVKVAKLVAILTVAGCATPRPTWTPMPFDEVEYAALAKEGTGTLRGQVFAKTRGGDVKKGAGNLVVLLPATKYGDQRYQEEFISNKLAAVGEDPRYVKYAKTKTTDGDGKFEFTNLPPGKYYLLSHITWESPSTSGGTELQGGRVFGKFEVKNGAATDAILTR